MYGQADVQIVDFILTQTGTYQSQERRPFETSIGQHHINTLADRTQDGRQITISSLQDIAGEILHPQATTEGHVNIAHGWTSRRFRFMMRVIEKRPFNANGTTQHVFFGYTDHCDASQNYLPPDMRIYFNSETVIANSVRMTPHGPVSEARVLSSDQIISPLDMSGAQAQVNGMYHRPTSYLIRPDDVFHLGQTANVVRNLDFAGNNGSVVASYDSRTMTGAGGAYKYSRRNDVSPSRYLNKTLSAYSNAVRESEREDITDLDYIYSEAMGHSANADMATNDFFSRLRDQAGYMEKGYVTLSELEAIFPELPTVTVFSMDNGQSIRKSSTAEQSNHWHGSSQTDIAAATLAQVIPAIMMDNFIRTVSFAVTNGHGIGQYLIEIHEHSTTSVVDNLPMMPYIEEFKRRLILDVLNTITFQNQIGFQLSMASDLAGESVIDLSIDGESIVRYVAPTFSDSLYTPVVTNDQTRTQKISNDLLYLADQTIHSSNVDMAHNILTATQNPQPHSQQPFNVLNSKQTYEVNYHDSGLL